MEVWLLSRRIIAFGAYQFLSRIEMAMVRYSACFGEGWESLEGEFVGGSAYAQ